jgi:hypothetical protein
MDMLRRDVGSLHAWTFASAEPDTAQLDAQIPHEGFHRARSRKLHIPFFPDVSESLAAPSTMSVTHVVKKPPARAEDTMKGEFDGRAAHLTWVPIRSSPASSKEARKRVAELVDMPIDESMKDQIEGSIRQSTGRIKN